MTDTLIVPAAVNHFVGTGPFRIDRPPISGGGIVKTVRGEVGQHTSFTQEPKPLRDVGFLTLIADVGDFRIKVGNFVGQVFAPADVDVALDSINFADHKYLTAQGPYQLTTVTTLPAGLALATDYWIIKVDDDNFKLASTEQNARDGVAVDITDQGTGDHTISGMHNVALAPAASVSDGTGAFLLPDGRSVVLEASEFVTVLSANATDTLTYFWSS